MRAFNTIVVACLAFLSSTVWAFPAQTLDNALMVKRHSEMNDLIADLDFFVAKREDYSGEELVAREYQIVTQVLTLINQTQVAPLVLQYVLDDPTLSKIAHDVILNAIENTKIDYTLLLTSLNDSGLAVDVIRAVISDCHFYKAIYDLVLSEIGNLGSLILRIISGGSITTSDIKKRTPEATELAVFEPYPQVYARDTQEIVTNLMESLKNSGLANQVVLTLVTNPAYLKFGINLVTDIIKSGAIDFGDLINAIIQSGLVPSLIKSFLNISTFKTVIVNALAAAFGKCGGNTATLTSTSASATTTKASSTGTGTTNTGTATSLTTQAGSSGNCIVIKRRKRSL
ncbi:uncharacterized protein KQ657_004212 [Scheffersomyces spartinae]|uniref:Opaque-phase-specific protein OP4 n=1 Tax=Scheffersomyces spartinae TaxID=45513 RepID=A0A9P7VCQ2_9ASCO|nr:uncharacterized protein KQ657_004212 [Scheffersomyces spartinae]KAG7195096.1 hypothetical protein KQ657_004212 [Scheffersomyces spartinae]